MTDHLYKHFHAFKIVDRELGDNSAFREMLDSLIHEPQEALDRDLPKRMRKILDYVDREVAKKLA